jgi:hypothetical protein
MDKDNAPNRSSLSAMFKKAAQPWDSLKYAVLTYPSKATAVTGAVADVMFGAQSYLDGNYLGVCAAAVGLYADTHLYLYGDPKILPEQAKDFIDPQDRRDITNWVNDPKKYPWEYVGLVRMITMSYMFLGGAGMGGNNTINWGDLAYSTCALAGYLIKMGVPEKPKGSVAIPETNNLAMRSYFKAKAFIQENPNPAAGLLWNGGLVPYAMDAAIKGDWLKIASAGFYFLPNTFTMLSSKRAQVLAEKSPSPP